MRPLLLATWLTLSGVAAAATTHSVAMTQYEHLQGERAKAEALAGAHASKSDLQRAASGRDAALERAIAELGTRAR